MAVPPPTKVKLRKSLKHARQRYVFEQNDGFLRKAAKALSARVVEHVSGQDIIATYVPIDAEIATAQLIEALSALKKTIALPYVLDRKDTPRFLRWRIGDPLEDGPFGLKQPSTDAQILVPDVILTPLLGFDRALNRIGYGAGYYDRAFAAHPAARRIGLAWSMQECANIPNDPWDIPLHAVATECEWITS